ncbi:MAG: T9SS type A sorting domain-containing protein [Saprospiraceae bacterium]|nr:T9SS type A sorting domain-containing protein [Saprospiraceae bacterium]
MIIVPNPIQNNFKIQSEYEISQIDIWDYSGKILYSDRPNQRILNLDSDIVNIVESGVYFCRIWIKNQAIIKKLWY